MEDDPQSFQIIGAAMEVHRELGPSHRNIVYRAALVEELKERGIPAPGSIDLSFTYKGKRLECIYIPFYLVCFEEVLVEVKNVPKLSADDQAELRADLQETGYERGLLLNFSRLRLEIRRVTKSAAPVAEAPPKTATPK